MTCCQSATYPRGWEAIPPLASSDLASSDNVDIQDIYAGLAENVKRRQSMPSAYRAHLALRIVGVAVVAIGLAVLVLALKGRLETFPQDFLQFFHNINWIHVELGAMIFVVLTGGALILIQDVKKKRDPLTRHHGGLFSGDAHWEAAQYKDEKGGVYPGYIDKSTLDEQGTGYAFLYGLKKEQDHYGISINVIAFTPVHMIGAIIYNILRILVVPFYILLNMQDATKKLSLKDIPLEIAKSLLRIVKAPFYAVAIIFAAIYSFFDPLNGRKLGAHLERAWNEDKTRVEGWWSVQGPQPYWILEGEGYWGEWIGAGFMFYLAGCWQPLLRVRYEGGKIAHSAKHAENLARAVNRTERSLYRGDDKLAPLNAEFSQHYVRQQDAHRTYTCYDATSALQKHQQLLAQLSKIDVKE